MLQRVCDRCLTPIAYKANTEDYVWIGQRSQDNDILNVKKYDLCPDCVGKFKRLLWTKTKEELEAEDLRELHEFTLNFFGENGIALPMVITWSKADMNLLINSICSYINNELIDRFHTGEGVTFKEVYRYFVIKETNIDENN